MHCEQVMIIHRAMFCWEDQTNLETRITTQIWYCFTTVMSKRNYVPKRKLIGWEIAELFFHWFLLSENAWIGEKSKQTMSLNPGRQRLSRFSHDASTRLSQLSITWHFWLIVNISWQEDSFRTFPFHSLRIIKQHLFSLFTFTFTFSSHSGSAYIATLVHLSLFLVGRMPWVSCEYFLWRHLFLYQHFWIVWLCGQPWPCHTVCKKSPEYFLSKCLFHKNCPFVFLCQQFWILTQARWDIEWK